MMQLVPIQQYNHVAKRDLKKNFPKDAKILPLSKKYSKTNSASCRKSFDFILFDFVEGKKFRDSSEYLDCVQNVWARSCLPCQILYIQ